MLLAAAAQAAELKIVSKHFETDERKGVTQFEGNVRISMGADELNASKVMVYVDANRKPKRFVATGNVAFRVTTETADVYSGRAQEVQFLPAEKEYRFYRDVHLKQLNKPKEINGDEVIVELAEGRAFAKGGERTPVMMIFKLDDANASHD